MIIVLTGKCGVGKTSILKKLNLKKGKILFLDEYIKNNFYKKGTKVFDLLVNTFGKIIVKNDRIDSSVLGKIVFSDKKKLNLLNEITLPYIKDIVKKLKGLWVVEMAIYINHENYFKDVVDKVILIRRKNKELSDKFLYLVKKHQPIKNKFISYDFIVRNNKQLYHAVNQVQKIINNIL